VEGRQIRAIGMRQPWRRRIATEDHNRVFIRLASVRLWRRVYESTR
jgi:hypothetical protein